MKITRNEYSVKCYDQHSRLLCHAEFHGMIWSIVPIKKNGVHSRPEITLREDEEGKVYTFCHLIGVIVDSERKGSITTVLADRMIEALKGVQ